MTIPFSILRDVVKAHEEQQGFYNATRNIRKRLRDGEDLPVGEENLEEESNLEGQLKEIRRRWKKPRPQAEVADSADL
jgi:hypothetical protein